MSINPKVTAGVLAAAVTTLLAWAVSLAGLEIPAEVQGAITTILVGVSGYLTPSNNEPGAHEA